MQLGRATSRGQNLIPTYVRRLTVFFVVGIGHAIVLYYGDILHVYALLGFALILFRNRSDRFILGWSAAIALIVLCAPFIESFVSLRWPVAPTGGGQGVSRTERLAAVAAGGWKGVVWFNANMLRNDYGSIWDVANWYLITDNPRVSGADSKAGGGEAKLGTFSTLSIGIGGMVGGGIFAVTGLTIEITKGAAPIAFLIAGIVALLTSYSYLKLTLRFPGEGGTVDFLNRAFGTGIVTGASNILLLLSYVVLVAIYAYAFGSYGASFFPAQDVELWRHVLMSASIIALVVLNVFSMRAVIRSENLLDGIKMLLLAGFVVAGLLTPMEWSRLGPENYVTPMGMVAGAMLIFLNYEGFELIANASGDVANPKRSLPIAYIGGVLIVITIYVLIVTVVVGHLSFPDVEEGSSRALSVAAHEFAGRAGSIVIAIAALLATSSAINATFYSSGRLTYIVAKTGELPGELKRSIRGQHLEGTLIAATLALVVANFVPLETIATMGSAGFLLLFMAVNISNVRLARETNSRAWLSGLAALSTAVALIVLCVEVEENPATSNHLWILVGMIAASFAIEITYRRISGRRILLARGAITDQPSEGM